MEIVNVYDILYLIESIINIFFHDYSSLIKLENTKIDKNKLYFT